MLLANDSDELQTFGNDLIYEPMKQSAEIELFVSGSVEKALTRYYACRWRLPDFSCNMRRQDGFAAAGITDYQKDVCRCGHTLCLKLHYYSTMPALRVLHVRYQLAGHEGKRGRCHGDTIDP